MASSILDASTPSLSYSGSTRMLKHVCACVCVCVSALARHTGAHKHGRTRAQGARHLGQAVRQGCALNGEAMGRVCTLQFCEAACGDPAGPGDEAQQGAALRMLGCEDPRPEPFNKRVPWSIAVGVQGVGAPVRHVQVHTRAAHKQPQLLAGEAQQGSTRHNTCHATSERAHTAARSQAQAPVQMSCNIGVFVALSYTHLGSTLCQVHLDLPSICALVAYTEEQLHSIIGIYVILEHLCLARVSDYLHSISMH